MSRTAKHPGLLKVKLSAKRERELAARREAWPTDLAVAEVIVRAFDDWREITGSVQGWAEYLALTLDDLSHIPSAETLVEVQEEQKAADVVVVQAFFENVPDDSILGHLSNELIESIEDGEPVRVVGE